MDWTGYLEPRDRDEAKRTAGTLTIVAAGVTLVFAIVVPAPGGLAARAVTFVVPAILILLGVLVMRAPQRLLLALWAPGPILGVISVAALDLATKDATAAGQVFLVYPVIYAGSQLRPVAALGTCAAAVLADAAVVLQLKPLTPALTDLCYVSAALLAMTVLLIRAGQRQDLLVGELRRQAAVDPLTGLATRRVLDDELRAALSEGGSGAGTVLGMLDIDRFKSVNDRYGHPVGDAVLIHIAEILMASTRPNTVVCRIGGDEVAFLLPDCSQRDAVGRAEQLVRQIRETPMTLPNGDQLRLSASVGVAHVLRPHAESVRELYAEADAALYNAKRAGRDRVGVPAVATKDDQSPHEGSAQRSTLSA